MATSSLMRSTAFSYTMLPVAPATVASASTSGTPALKVTARVREKRAMAELCRIWPMTGTFSRARSMNSAKARERFRLLTNGNPAPMTMPRITHHHLIMKSEAAMIISVNAGRSAPKPLNRFWKVGTTKISRMAETMNATTMITAG